MRYERIYFDFDGTLLDTSPGVMHSLKAVLSAAGVPFTPQDLSTFIGPPMFTELQRVFHLSAEKAEAITLNYRAHYKTEGMYQNARFSGVEAILKRLKSLGKRLYVVTNKPEPFAKAMLAYEKLDHYFDKIIGAQMTDRTDRKTERLKAILAEGHGDAIMVGDRENDIFAAHGAGIDSVYVGYGFGTKAESDACKPTYYAADTKELAKILGAYLFVTFEGGDGAGKSTQIGLLREYLEKQGQKVILSREPGGCAIAEKIREILLDKENFAMTPRCEALLYAASRAQHVDEVLAPALEDGKIILCDRYYDSSVAYQVFGRGLAEKDIAAINRFAMAGVTPTRTYYLCAESKKALSRIDREKDRIELAGVDFAMRVKIGFDSVQKREPERVFFIDAACTIAEISDIIKRDIDTYLI